MSAWIVWLRTGAAFADVAQWPSVRSLKSEILGSIPNVRNREIELFFLSLRLVAFILWGIGFSWQAPCCLFPVMLVLFTPVTSIGFAVCRFSHLTLQDNFAFIMLFIAFAIDLIWDIKFFRHMVKET